MAKVASSSETPLPMDAFRLPAGTSIRSVHLQISAMDRSLGFYRDLMGFGELRHDGSVAWLAPPAGKDPIIGLTERREARRRPPGSTGLFHFAILYPSRRELARILRRLYENGWPLHGLADHGVSEAVYLSDPDGIAIELYADRSRDNWPVKNRELQMVTEPLDVEEILSELTPEPNRSYAAPAETRIGHVHLQVSDLANADKFYHGILGFDVTQRSYPGALFVSAGGYHHHIGLNIWSSRGASPPPPDAVGLVRFCIQVPDERTIETLNERLREAGRPCEERERDGTASLTTRDLDDIEIEILHKHNHRQEHRP